MKKIETQASGFVMVLALVIMAVTVALIAPLVTRVMVQAQFAKTATLQEQAKVLALSGIQVAQALLAQESAKEDEERESLIAITQLVKEFTYEDGVVQVCISSENSKIQASSLYDSKQKKMTPLFDAFKKNFTELSHADDCVEQCEKFFKERGEYPLYDVTELLAIPWCAKQGLLWVLQVFTLYNPSSTLYPVFFTQEMMQLLGLKLSVVDKQKEMVQKKQEVSKKIKPSMDWQRDWNTLLAPFYGKEYTSISSEIRKILSGKFESIYFSVVSYGTVADVTQSVCAIIERKKLAASQTKEKSSVITYSIKRLYWL